MQCNLSMTDEFDIEKMMIELDEELTKAVRDADEAARNMAKEFGLDEPLKLPDI